MSCQKRRSRWHRRLVGPLEWAVFVSARIIVAPLPVAVTSAIFGWVTQAFGRLSRRHLLADQQLAYAMPELTSEKRHAILSEMWNNLGRTIGEYAKLKDLVPGEARVTIEGAHHIIDQCASSRPILVFSAHFGHWELVTSAACVLGLTPLNLVYRPINNTQLEQGVRRLQAAQGVRGIRKGSQGARSLLLAVAAGENALMLVDQKMNNGIAVPFFGHVAMTAPALAKLAYRYHATILPMRAERLRIRGKLACCFRIVIEPPFSPCEGW